MISYEIFKGHAYAVGGDGESKRTEIRFSPKTSGYLIVGGYAFDVIDGVALADLRGLEDAEHTAVLYTENGAIGVDGIRKRGRKIELIPPDAEATRALGKMLRSTSREIEDIKKEIEYLRLKIDGVSVL